MNYNNTPQQSGASVHAHGRIPSVDLASLVSCLVKAIPRQPDRPNECYSWPVLAYDAKTQRLTLDTYGVLRRAISFTDFQALFRQSDSSGFLRDLSLPPRDNTAKTGGKLFADNVHGLSEGVSTLKKLLAEELDRLGVPAEHLLVPDPLSALTAMAQKMGIKDWAKELSASMVRVGFASSDASNTHEKDIARVISAQEEVQAEDWLERLITSITEAHANRDEEFDDIQRDKLAATLRQDFRKSDSQITRFLNFLEDEALARVRLAVSFAIMQALAAQIGNTPGAAGQDFADYVNRVMALFNLYGDPETEEYLEIDLSRAYGLGASFPVSNELVKATFYGCLPTWAEWNTQLFESRRVDETDGGVSVVREVSYRFRVNGKDPRSEGHLNAYDARLQRLRKVLIAQADDYMDTPYRIRRGLSEAMFLWLVLNPALKTSDLQHTAETLAQRLHEGGRSAVAQLLDELEGWSPRVKALSRTLVALLQAKSRNIIAHAQRAVSDLYVVVQEDVVDWQAIERARGRTREPLVKPGEGQSEKIEWFKHIKIAKRPTHVIGSLFSVRVQTSLKERTLIAREGDTEAIAAVREIPEKMLNVTWVPINVDLRQRPHQAIPRVEVDIAWQMGPGVDIRFEPEMLRSRKEEQLNPKQRKTTEEDRHQYRAATAAALTVLVYVFLQLLAERTTKALQARPAALMLRFQTQGKEASDSEGDPLIYAAAQAVESALMRDLPVRMQGLVDQGENLYFKARGAAAALASAFPLVIATPLAPAASKVAVIVYTTRPCDEHPALADADGFVFRAKTYLAEAVHVPLAGYRLSFDRMQTYVVDNHDEFRNPKLIVEEISRLHVLGFDHILMISNHFGNRRINRSAQRHSPHTQTAFVEEVAKNFSQVNLYMLRRDVFPATRLHRRSKQESAFEVLRINEHDAFAHQAEGVQKQLVPAYTFATLAIVGNDDAARPQSGFCTYFLDADQQISNVEWRERVRSNFIGTNHDVRESLLAVLRGLHFLEAEKAPQGQHFQPVLDPFSWVNPSSNGAAGEIPVFPASRRKGKVLLSLPALLSHVTDALHRGRG